MFKNYFKTAWRNIVRHKLFSGLNIFGLATGMACSILIFMWVRDELRFDTFNRHADHIFRLTSKGPDAEYAVAPPSMAAAVQTEIPAIENATRVKPVQKMITVGTKKFDEKNIYYADSNFLKIFNYPLSRGNIATALSAPNSIVLTEKTARKYFGSVDAAMGKTVYIDNDIKGTTLLVTGILKNIPSDSHLQPDMLIPMDLYDKTNNPAYGWTNFDVYVYFRLKEAIAPTAANLGGIQKQVNEIFKENNQDFPASFETQSLTDIHLHSHCLLDLPGQGNIRYVNIFALIAIFIMIIACINFMNLSTALSGQRAKEVGLRKTVGALKRQLIAQFIGESLILSFVSLVLAILLVYLLLPLFNQLSNKSIALNPFDVQLLGSLLAIALLTGLISGTYPAFFLSSFNPVKALKGVKTLQGKRSFFRNGLVVLQFSISVVLIIGTLVIYKQLQYIQNRDIGFNKENLLYMKMPAVGDLKNNQDALRGTLAGYPGISSYTFIDELPTNLVSTSQLTWRGMNPGTQVMAHRLRVDEDFAKTFGIPMAAGRFFSKDFGGDDSGYVVNETALKAMGLNLNNAIGKVISISLEDKEAPIIGVVKDFNFQPVQKPIEPLVMKTRFQGGYVVMRTTPATIQKVLARVQKIFHNVYGDYPFSYGFVNDDLSKLYLTEQRMEKLFNAFSILSIVISCLGLFGLSTFAAQRRIKEIGVRKVLGARESGIVALLSKDFLRLVLIACLVAFPLSYLGMYRWLQSFAYRIHLSWWIFAVAGSMALLIALITVSFQAIKAAIANPVNSLRSE